MFDLALAVAASATGLIAGSGLTFLRNRRASSKAIGGGGCAVDDNEVPSRQISVICGAPAPGEKLCCEEDLGHWGWHSASQATWWGTTWGPGTQEDISTTTSNAEPIKAGDNIFDTASPKNGSHRPQSEDRSERYLLFEDRLTTPRKPLRFSVGLFGTRYPIADDEPTVDEVQACADPKMNQSGNGDTQRRARNAAGSKSTSTHPRRFLTVPLGSNPSESDVSAARFAEKWINGYTVERQMSPHKSQPVFFRRDSVRPWDGPMAV